MNEHYSTPEPTSEERFSSYTYRVADAELVIATVSGVFGKSGLDRGSQVLIESVELNRARSLLDLGCGTGVIGIALAKRFSLEVTFSDVNERAVRIAKDNARTNGVRGRFIVSDGFSHIPDRFDAIVLNPPQSAGKAVCESLIDQARTHLNNAGQLFLVARHKKGGRSLSDHMEAVFGNVDVVTRASGYRVYVSEVSV